MSISLLTNLMSMKSPIDLTNSKNTLSTIQKRLSSGMQINTAKDSPSQIGTLARMSAQVRGFNQSLRNANDNISLSQTAQGALKDTTDILQRMRELTIQAGNGTNTNSDLNALDEEFNQLRNQISYLGFG